jgi:SAM-dependent methyltransferase
MSQRLLSSQTDATLSSAEESCQSGTTKRAQKTEFDEFACRYEALFKPWLKIAGAPREHFARARLNWLSYLLREEQVSAKRVMDFGCGTGMSFSFLADILGADWIIGLDTSEESLAVARESPLGHAVELTTPDKYFPKQDLDLVFCNGVFHHIPVTERSAAVNFIYRSLRPGGIFALWENNPRNPIHAFAMKHSKIDENAVPLAAPEACSLVASERFRIIRTDYMFFFPAYFSWLQKLETSLVKLPLGAQYQVLSKTE